MKVLIHNGIVAAILDNMPPFPEPLPDGMEIRDDASHLVQTGWGFKNGTYRKPNLQGEVEPTHPQNYLNAQIAKQDLLLSERVISQFYENGDPVTQDWKDYRAALRSIIRLENDTTTPPTPIPEHPPLPPGMLNPAAGGDKSLGYF
jgi:hypothetical protein